MGGMSIEREVSFNSGRTVCDHLDTSLYEVIPLFQTDDNRLFILPWHFLHRGKIADFYERLITEAQQIKFDEVKSLVDFVYLAVHGKYAEDGTVQGLLEVLGVPYLGTKLWGSAINMDKTEQKKVLQKAGVAVPDGFTVYPQELESLKVDTKKLQKLLENNNLKLPVIIKPNHEGSSLGVTVVHEQEQLLPAIMHAATIDPERMQPVVIEEKIEGMEFCCVTLFDHLDNPINLPPTEIVHEVGTHLHDYTQKYMPGRALKFTPARVDKKVMSAIQETCLKVARLLEFKTMARTDGFVTKEGKIIIIDPNALTGMAPSSFVFNQAAEIGMSHTDLINHLIAVELQQQGIVVNKKNSSKKAEKKLRVAVLLGGDSNERETSLDSGRNICYKLSPEKYDVIPLFVDAKRELYPLNQKLLVHNSTQEIEHDLDRTTKINWHDLPSLTDFVFIGLHGGCGENGAIQGLLELLKLPYNGSGIAASSLCIDKHKTNNFLAGYGFEVPQNYFITKQDFVVDQQAVLKKITETLKFPLIVKPHNDGCSFGVKKVTTEQQLAATVSTLFKNYTALLIEECITGMELTVGVIGNQTVQALPPSQAVAVSEVLSIEEKFLPGAGQNLTPAPLPKDALKLVQQTVQEVYQTVGCSGYARIDCFYQTQKQSPTGKERVVIIEINTLPGMTPATCIFHQAAEIGIKPMDFIDLLVHYGLEKHTSYRGKQLVGDVHEAAVSQKSSDSSIISVT